jgi:hypothetical protein
MPGDWNDLRRAMRCPGMLITTLIIDAKTLGTECYQRSLQKGIWLNPAGGSEEA